MGKAIGPTIYVPVRLQDEVEKYCRASAGPRASLTGMCKQYWGDGPVIKCGAYIYLMWYEDFVRFRDRI